MADLVWELSRQDYVLERSLTAITVSVYALSIVFPGNRKCRYRSHHVVGIINNIIPVGIFEAYVYAVSLNISYIYHPGWSDTNS